MGVYLALLALVSWGFGDFLIQKSTRAFGDWIALFFIEIFGTIVLLPFVWDKFDNLLILPNLIILIAASIAILIAALFNLEALKVGKISVIEPVYALEIPITVLLSTVILKEILNTDQSLLVTAIILGITLVSIKQFSHLRNIHLEKGVWLAIIGTIAMGVSNFLFGVGSREIDPLMINWFTGLFLSIICIGYLYYKKELNQISTSWNENKKLIIGVSIFDNIAWISYSASTLFIPIAIATGISESYIAMAAILGFIYNKERLNTHQWLGLVVCIVAVIILSFISQ